jgi:hypothetical protein
LEIGEKNRIVNYEMISGDSHIDLSWLPPDLLPPTRLAGFQTNHSGKFGLARGKGSPKSGLERRTALRILELISVFDDAGVFPRPSDFRS